MIGLHFESLINAKFLAFQRALKIFKYKEIAKYFLQSHENCSTNCQIMYNTNTCTNFPSDSKIENYDYEIY